MKMMRLLLVLLMLSGIFLIFGRADADANPNQPQHAADRFRVKLTAKADAATDLPEEYNSRSVAFGIPTLDDLLTKYQAEAVVRAHIRPMDTAWEKKTGFDRWFIIQVPIGTDIPTAVADFGQCAEIEEADYEHYLYPTFVPNDPYYSNNWGHNNTQQLLKWDPPNNPSGSHSGIPVGVIGFDSNAAQAWEYPQGMGSTAIVIAVIDTGFDRSHPDLRFTTGYDFGCGDANPDFTYNSAHGTCCAGIAAAKGHNGIGITGVAGNCYVMPLKVTDAWGYFTTTAINNSLIYAADHGADIVSMSFGSTNGLLTNTYCDYALEYAYNHGLTLFAATGNDDHYGLCYPAYNQYVISVGAASPEGYRKFNNSGDGEYWWGSNWGSNTQNDRFSVDIMGPTILPATDIVGSGGYDAGNYDLYFNGTSCATPYVAGVAALVKSRNPSLTPEQVRTALTSTAIDLYYSTLPGWDRYTGYGFVNAFNALYSVSDGTPFCRITSPVTLHGITIGETVRISVTAFDTNTGGSINRVEFYLDSATTPAYTDNAAPYYWDWNTTGVSYESHIIKAKAYDNEGNSYTHSIQQTLLYAASDGFEATFLSTLPWITTGDADWYLETDEFYCGSKAVCSGDLTQEGDTSSLTCTVNITTAGNYYFYRKLVSEVTYDYLRFYLDNVLMQEWSGNVSWYWYQNYITTGVHTFKWVYTHGGGSVHYGKAFLDHFKLPPFSANTNPDIQWGPSSFTSTIPQGSFDVQYLHISNWNSPAVTFLAHLPVKTLTQIEETFPTLSTLPTGWSSTNELGNHPWTVNTGGFNSLPPTAYDGEYNARFTVTTSAAITRLTLPPIDLSLATSATLSFWHTQMPVQLNGTGAMGVYYKTSAGGNWILLQSYTSNLNEWTRESIALPNLSSTYYISFLGTGNTYYTICLDKVRITKRSYAETTTPWCRFEVSNYITDTIGPMSFYTYMFQFSSIGLNPGTYESEITITSNCTANPVITIPVTLNVYAATLDAPVNLTITRNETGDAVILNWQAPPGFPSRYDIYKAYAQDFSDGVLIGNVPGSQTTFIDPSDFTMRKAFYRIKAVRD